MSIPNYRVVLSFDGERKVFTARAPELDHCAGEGATRGEAVSRLEQEIEAQLKNMSERGNRPPVAIDEHSFTGELATKVSRTLHRDLAWQARQEGIELNQLISELLAAGLDGRRHGGRRPARQGGEAHGNQASDRPHDRENAGNQRDSYDRGGGGGSREGRGYGSRYHGILDDRANFIEYVRGLDDRGGRPRQGPGPAQQGGPADRGGPGRNNHRRPRNDRKGPGGPPRPPGANPNQGAQGGHAGAAPSAPTGTDDKTPKGGGEGQGG